MSRVLTVVAAGLLLASAVHASAANPVLSASTAQSAGTADDVAGKVKAKLDAEPELKNHTIAVTASNGSVTLEGEAPSLVGRAQAGELAKNTEGVRKVHNKLKVSKTDAAGSQ